MPSRTAAALAAAAALALLYARMRPPRYGWRLAIVGHMVNALRRLTRITDGGSLSRARWLYAASQRIIPRPSIGAVEDLSCPAPAGGVTPLRSYRPRGAEKRPLPIVFYMHGGGWVINNIETHDPLCRQLCRESGCQIISVDYKLAPESKFPGPIEECYAALRWVHDHQFELGGNGQVAVAGDSAGGTMATVLAKMCATEQTVPLSLQALLYPATMYPVDLKVSRSWAEHGPDAIVLDRGLFEFFFQQYLRSPADGDDPRVSPLRYKDLEGVAPALVVTADYDPLSDEGKLYASKLESFKVPVERLAVPSCHSFLTLGLLLPEADQGIAAIAKSLRAAFQMP